MKDHPVHSAIGLFLVLAVIAGIIGYIAYSQDGVITETVEVGTEGIKKAEEVKRFLEESSQSQSEI